MGICLEDGVKTLTLKLSVQSSLRWEKSYPNQIMAGKWLTDILGGVETAPWSPLGLLCLPRIFPWLPIG